MDDDVLSFMPLEGADGCHDGATDTQAVSRTLLIDVARVQAEGTMVTVFAAAWEWSNETTAVFAFEHFVGSLSIVSLATIATRAILLIIATAMIFMIVKVVLVIDFVFCGETKIFFVYFLQCAQGEASF